MDARQFLAEFVHIVNAPGGVERLREMILALAMKGDLVEPLDGAENGKLIVERIYKRKQKYKENGELKKQKPLLELSKGELPERIPEGWEYARLGNLLNVINGRAYKKDELLQSGTPVLRVGNLFTSTSWYYSDLVLNDDKYIDKSDLIYAWSASFGPFIWEGEKVIYHYHIWKMDFYSQDELDKKFIYYYLLEKTQEIKASGSGIAMIHMTKERMEKLPIPVPPLEEQKRIVAKVDELMALCDKLEAQQQKRRKRCEAGSRVVPRSDRAGRFPEAFFA